MQYSIWAWAGFALFILFMLALDLGVLNRKAHTPSYREAAVWSAVWVTLALIFGAGVFWQLGSQRGLEFLTGYVIELSLSVDNLFVFLLLFAYFRVPSKYQHRVLFWGVLGALIMRILMIGLGAAMINRFGWIIYIFGAFLVFTGIKMMVQKETESNPEEGVIVRFVTRFIPIERRYEGDSFFTRVNGRLAGTLLLLVLIIVEITDLVFAVDSIPAIFGVTKDTFIIYTSNVFAILGLRSLYFLLAGVVEKFHYLKMGLVTVLTFVGLKMLTEHFVEHYLDKQTFIGISLGVVALVLLGSVAASLIWPKRAETNIEVQLPKDFNSPHDDDQGHLGADEPQD